LKIMELSTPLSGLPKIGPKTAKSLKAIGLETIEDLLWHLPFRYDDFSKTVKIKDLVSGQKANIVGEIELINNRRAHRRRMYITEALIRDDSEGIKVIWFNQPFIAKTLKPGDTVSLAGEARDDGGIMTMVSPIYEKMSPALTHTSGLVPIYHCTEGITQKQLRFFIKQSLTATKELKDILPESTVKKLKLLSIKEAIEKTHFPKTYEESAESRRRLAFEEIFLAQIKSQIIKRQKADSQADKVVFKEKETREFVSKLPFQLTDDQKKSAWRILQEMETGLPMSRLLNGDVGSGKTLVAIIALLNTALNGFQGVIMAPTEILARQHFNSICKLLSDLPLKIAILSNSCRLINGKEEKIPRAELLKTIKAGEIDIIVGTHALVQDDVKFKKLALAVIDEQHRFRRCPAKRPAFQIGDKKISAPSINDCHPNTKISGLDIIRRPGRLFNKRDAKRQKSHHNQSGARRKTPSGLRFYS
jgi:ATP-dependent DNA helicase RecG